MLLVTDLARQLLQSATLEAVTRVATHTVRLSLSGPALVGWAYVPGQTLNVFFGFTPYSSSASLRKRTYSTWGYEGVAGRLELVVCTFSDGVGAR